MVSRVMIFEGGSDFNNLAYYVKKKAATADSR